MFFNHVQADGTPVRLCSTGVEKVNFFLGPQTEKENIFCQNPKVPPTLRTRETSFTPRISCYHLPFKKVKEM